jgi:hypothetical protein
MLRIWSLTIFCIVFAASDITPVQAQGAMAPVVVAQSEGGGLFRSLFGKRRKVKRGRDFRKNAQPQRPARTTKSRSTGSSSRSTASRPTAVATAKSPDAKTVLVIGDFMANALAKGLSVAFSSNPDIDVVNANNGSSGLVRDDYYNWPAKTPELVAKHEADILVVMVGANDRQVIRASGGQIAVNSEAWRKAYEAKVTAFADVLAMQNKPVIWLSLVPVGSNSLSRDYSSFNGIYRQKAELKGIHFADVWNGFADDKGGYVSSGPDINGQSRQLRSGDGLNFTKAGQRKLAFFVEREIARFLDDDQTNIFASLGGTGGDPSAPELTPAVPAISPMIPIEMIDVRAGSGLSSAPVMAGKPVEDTEKEKTADAEKAGETENTVAARRPVATPPPGRADNYSWPAPN